MCVNVTTEVMSIFVPVQWRFPLAQPNTEDTECVCVLVSVFTCDLHQPQSSNAGKTHCYVTPYMFVAVNVVKI